MAVFDPFFVYPAKGGARAGHNQPGIRYFLVNGFERPHQVNTAFAAFQPAEEQDVLLPVGEPFKRLDVIGVLLDIDAVGNDRVLAGNVFPGVSHSHVGDSDVAVEFTPPPLYHPGADGFSPVIAGPAVPGVEGTDIDRIRKTQDGAAEHRHERLVKMDDIEFFPFQHFLDCRSEMKRGTNPYNRTAAGNRPGFTDRDKPVAEEFDFSRRRGNHSYLMPHPGKVYLQ